MQAAIEDCSARVHINEGAASILPANWKPHIAPTVNIPEDLCLQQVDIELFNEDSIELNDVCNPNIPLAESGGINTNKNFRFDGLIHLLSHTFDRFRTFEKWIDTSAGSYVLSPSDLRNLFSVFTTPESQVLVARKLKAVFSTISCEHIKEAAASCHDVSRREVVELLCGIPIQNTESSALVEEVIGLVEFALVQHYFSTIKY